MKQIIAVGGGGFTAPNSELKIEKYILSLSSNPRPKICFLPQASNEAQNYVVKFYETFTKLDAEPSWISLFGRVEPSWQEKILQQDIIYVGGGNTRSMLALWREWGMDKLLIQAYEQGTILSGISAGAICWFEDAITDSVWPLGILSGLGLLNGSCCPHYDTELERRPMFLEAVANAKAKPGIALQDGTAAHYVDGKLKQVIKADSSKKAFYLRDQDEKELELLDLTK